MHSSIRAAIFAAATILIAAALWIGIAPTRSPFGGADKPSNGTGTTPTATDYAPDRWKVWRSGVYSQLDGRTYGYALEYPRDFEILRGEQALGNSIGSAEVSLLFPDDAYDEPKTNFGGGVFTVAVANGITEDECLSHPFDGTRLDEEVVVGDTIFKIARTIEAAAGSAYTSEFHRTMKDGKCYEIAMTIRTANIGNFEPGAVEEFDKERGFAVLRRMLETFEFTVEQH